MAFKLLIQRSPRNKSIPEVRNKSIHFAIINIKVGIMGVPAKIKVIKKSEKSNNATTEDTNGKTTKQSAREIVSTVTNWVTDFQQRSRVDTKQAINQLFSQQTQTN